MRKSFTKFWYLVKNQIPLKGTIFKISYLIQKHDFYCPIEAFILIFYLLRKLQECSDHFKNSSSRRGVGGREVKYVFDPVPLFDRPISQKFGKHFWKSADKIIFRGNQPLPVLFANDFFLLRPILHFGPFH